MDGSAKTYEAWKYNEFIWRVLGVYPTKKYKFFYYIYALFINITVAVFYPLSLIIGLFSVQSVKVLLENLSLNITVVICSLKAFNIFFKQKSLYKIKELTKKLDARAMVAAEWEVLQKGKKRCRQLFVVYATLYSVVAIVGEISILLAKERRLMYPAWFPFDWRASNFNYWAVHVYQLVGIYIQILHNLTNDTYPGIYLCILCSHIQALCIRIRKLGTDPKKTEEEHFKELTACIKDHLIILEYSKTLENVLSIVVFLQFLFSEVSLCITAIYATMVKESFLEFAYVLVYFIAIVQEITCTCYYGNELTVVSDQITTALYSSNWTTRDKKFKKALIMFMSKTQKQVVLLAANIVAISLSTLITVGKTAYSLFAVLSQMKSLKKN